jgi:hypothetical protein
MFFVQISFLTLCAKLCTVLRVQVCLSGGPTQHAPVQPGRELSELQLGDTAAVG